MGLWFSVYEEILNDPKLRHAAQILETSQSEVLGSLAFIWCWGLHNADEEGKILHAGKEDLADAIRSKVRREYGLKAEEVIQALCEAGFIDETDGDLYIHNWGERQKFYHKFARKREVDRNRQRTKATAEPEKPTAKESVSKPAITKYSTDFEEFWKVYPNSKGKGECYKKYKARLNDGFSPEQLKMAAQKYAAEVRRKGTDKDFIKHGKTFLSDALPFMDYLPKKESVVEANDEDPFAEWRQ